MTWDPVYRDGIPVEMRWYEDAELDARIRRCPRTWPHEPHGPWYTGEIRPASEATSFDCPGVKYQPESPA